MAENILSYKYLLSDILNFKRGGSIYSNLTRKSVFDTPSQKYFKILFYFGSATTETGADPEYSSGLLAPTWLNIEKSSEQPSNESDDDNKNKFELLLKNKVSRNDIYNHNSAWSFLVINDELERAEKLEQFISLLSDISSNSPWYFNTVTGVQEALERKFTEEGKLDVTQPRKLTINCLPDAYDNRISTLLDLYRDITWSWIHKKEIVPANLRKFDMAIYIFEAPTAHWHDDVNSSLKIGNEYDENRLQKLNISYKMLEFHDCEFNYNSSKAGWGELNNQNGISPTHNIEIFYNDCYEYSYNDFMTREIGDVILTDLFNSGTYNDMEQIDNSVKSTPGYTTDEKIKLLNTIYTEPIPKDYDLGTSHFDGTPFTEKKLPNDIFGKSYNTLGNISTKGFTPRKGDAEVEKKLIPQKGFLSNAIGQVAGAFVSDVKGMINKALLGNLFGFSLTNIGRQIGSALKGDVIRTGMTVKNYIDQYNENEEAFKNAFKFSTHWDNLFGKDQWKDRVDGTMDAFIPNPKDTDDGKLDNIFSDYEIDSNNNNNNHRNSDNIVSGNSNNITGGQHRRNMFEFKSNNLDFVKSTIMANKNIHSNSSIANNL